MVGRVNDMAVPGARHAHGVESGILEAFDVGFIDFRVAPSGLTTRHFHRVADIDSGKHVGCNLTGIHAQQSLLLA